MNEYSEGSRGWMIVHAILALAVPAVIALVVGCLREPEVGPPELGPQASEEEVERVISKALYGIDPWKSFLGQQVIYDFNARVEASDQVQPLLRLTQTIMRREQLNDPPRLKIITENHEVDLRTGEFLDRSESEPVEYPGSSAQALNIMSNSWTINGLQSMSGLKPAAESRPVKKVSYHNLRESSGEMAPPSLVIAKPNCGDVPGCKLRYYKVEYDEARWYSDTDFSVQRWLFTISRDAPFIAYIIERCLGSIVAYDGRRVYIRQCQFARDFSYSGATAP